MDLYQLERMKIKWSTYFRAISGIFISLLFLGMLFLFILPGELPEEVGRDAELFAEWNGLFALMTALAFACFSVFAAVLAAKVIVSDYCGRNAVFLLSYPIRRKAILAAKCRIVCGMTIGSVLISNLLVTGLMQMTAHIFGIVLPVDLRHFIPAALISSILAGTLSSAAGMIAAVVGWKKNSAAASIVCATILVCAVTNFIVISPDNIVFVLSALNVLFIGGSSIMYQILANGIEKMEV